MARDCDIYYYFAVCWYINVNFYSAWIITFAHDISNFCTLFLFITIWSGYIVFRFYTDYFSQLIGRFRGATQLYSRVPGVEINWPYGKPPDVPRCGFRNDKCIIQGICIKFWIYWKPIHFKDPLMLCEKIRDTYFIISLFKGGVWWGQQTSVFSERSRCMTLSLYLLSVVCDNLNLYKVEQSSKLILT